MTKIYFFSEGLNFKLKNTLRTSAWIKRVIKQEKGTLESLNYIFCSDAFLLSLNKQYLDHGTLTDIITFDQSENKQTLSGEIYISVERVEENASKFGVTIEEELHRVIIHGVLHLLGYNDKTKAQRIVMREKEQAYLSLRN